MAKEARETQAYLHVLAEIMGVEVSPDTQLTRQAIFAALEQGEEEVPEAKPVADWQQEDWESLLD